MRDLSERRNDGTRNRPRKKINWWTATKRREISRDRQSRYCAVRNIPRLVCGEKISRRPAPERGKISKLPALPSSVCYVSRLKRGEEINRRTTTERRKI